MPSKLVKPATARGRRGGGGASASLCWVALFNSVPLLVAAVPLAAGPLPAVPLAALGLPVPLAARPPTAPPRQLVPGACDVHELAEDQQLRRLRTGDDGAERVVRLELDGAATQVERPHAVALGNALVREAGRRVASGVDVD